MKPIVKGGSNFRPVDFAHAEDGSVFFTDWVNASYQLHGQGKVWKLTPIKGSKPEKQLAIKNETFSLADIDDDIFSLASFFWSYQKSEKKVNLKWNTLSENSKVALLTSTSWKKNLDPGLIKQALSDSSSKVKIAAIRIVADRKIVKHKMFLEKILKGNDQESQLSKVAESALKKIN